MFPMGVGEEGDETEREVDQEEEGSVYRKSGCQNGEEPEQKDGSADQNAPESDDVGGV
jgi:hypothetical protein